MARRRRRAETGVDTGFYPALGSASPIGTTAIAARAAPPAVAKQSAT